MKTYWIEFEGGRLSFVLNAIGITILCLSLIGLPTALMVLPTMYRIVQE